MSGAVADEARDAVADLRRIAFLLERAHESTYRVRAFRTAAAVLARRTPEELSAMILSALPPGVFLFVMVTQPEYMQPLYNDGRGIIVLVGAVAWPLR